MKIEAQNSNKPQKQQLNILAVRRSFFNFKYKWSMRKYWIGWFKRDLKRWYYSKIHGFNMDGFNGTMIPTTGKGKFISVYSKGRIIQIKHENGYEHLEYHGVMVERFKNGKMCDRNHVDLNQFNKGIIFASNVEQLTGR